MHALAGGIVVEFQQGQERIIAQFAKCIILGWIGEAGSHGDPA
jgi:hypothetical protein